jgi:5-methylcytosine-specific restriction endonuclease McrA
VRKKTKQDTVGLLPWAQKVGGPNPPAPTTNETTCGDSADSQPQAISSRTALRSDPERMRAYKRQWVSARRAEYFAGKACAKCESTERLELDHIDPATKEHHAVWSWTKARRDAELQKCQALCHACHKAKTNHENSERMKGKPCHRARAFNPEQVLEIRRLLGVGVRVRELARRYSVSHSVISDINLGLRYREIINKVVAHA